MNLKKEKTKDIIFNEQMIEHIYKFMSCLEDKIAISSINKVSYNLLKNKVNFAIMQKKLKIKLSQPKNELLYCINSMSCKNNALNEILFFYPEFLTEKIDWAENNIFIEWIRFNELKNGRKIKRFIPYCQTCMDKYVNYGYRKDGQPVSFSHALCLF